MIWTLRASSQSVKMASFYFANINDLITMIHYKLHLYIHLNIIIFFSLVLAEIQPMNLNVLFLQPILSFRSYNVIYYALINVF